jgi:hypothetical protein
LWNTDAARRYAPDDCISDQLGGRMATWDQFCAVAPTAGGKELSPAAWVFDLPGVDEGRTQKVFVFYEVIQPAFGIVRVSSPVAAIADVDVESVLKSFGQLLVGGIGYSPDFADDGHSFGGFLTIASSVPLAALDLSDATQFLLYLFILAKAADDVELKISSTGAIDPF